MKKIALLLSLLCLPLFAQSATDASKELIYAAGSPRVVKDEEMLIEGLAIVPGGTKVDTVARQHGISIYLEEGNFESLETSLLEFLNQPLNESNIAKIKDAIVQYFRSSRNQYVAAIVPVQQVVNGVVVLQILEGKVGKIEYRGQKWFSKRVIKNGLGIRRGDPVIETNFLNAVTWVNRNPFHNTRIVLVPGQEKGITDLVFMTKDRFPARFFAGSDNTGFLSNSETRLYGGFNWGDALMLGDLLSYQYTASPDFHKFQSHVANYTSFLPWKHIFTVFGCYGQVYPAITGFKTQGVNIQGSGRYQIPFRPLYGDFRSHLEIGFDWKYLTSNLFFAGDIEEVSPVANQYMTITQFLLGYRFQQNWGENLLSFRMDMMLSPWQDWWFPHQTSAEYNSLRLGSHVRYAYWKGSIGDVYRTSGKWTLSALVRGQLATGTLPTAEQFGLGGANTVRGYYEQQFIADNAFCFNFEVYTPPVGLFKTKTLRNELSFVAFVDYGYGYNYSILAPEFREQHLIGIGPGLRYDISTYFSLKLDYGFQLKGITGDSQIGRLNFSAIASY